MWHSTVHKYGRMVSHGLQNTQTRRRDSRVSLTCISLFLPLSLCLFLGLGRSRGILDLSPRSFSPKTNTVLLLSSPSLIDSTNPIVVHPCNPPSLATSVPSTAVIFPPQHPIQLRFKFRHAEENHRFLKQLPNKSNGHDSTDQRQLNKSSINMDATGR